MVSKRARTVLLAAVLALAPALAACGGSDNESTAASGGGAKAGATKICAAYSDTPSVKDIPTLMAFDDLAKNGIDVEVKKFADGDQAVQAIVTGKCDVGFNGSFGAMLAANEAGAKLKALGVSTANEFSLVGAKSITAVSQLNGARYGVFSQLSYDKAMAEVAAKKAGVTPKYIVSGGSDARGPALVAGRLDATGLDAQTIAVLQDQGQDDKINVIESFNDALPGLITNTVYTSSDYLGAHHDAVVKLMEGIDASYAANATDAATLKQVGEKKLEAWDTVDAKAVDAYVDQKLWPESPSKALTEKTAKMSAQFYKDAGNIKAVPDVSQVIDPSIAGS